MTERRFNEAEIAAILERASKTDAAAPRRLEPGEGLTLGQLQEIGREVGIASDAIRDAPRIVDQGGLAMGRHFIGLPIGVGRDVSLGRALTDDEWDRFVVDLRETFAARGVVRHEGSLRQWTNGNLQVLLEPTASGYRMRMRTMRSQSRALMLGGIGFIGVSAVALVGALVGGTTGVVQFSVIAELALIGGGMFGLGAVRLPGWARSRRRQMEQLAERLVSMTGVPPAAG
ncbi:MAG TPA: hypothetical protein VH277_02930 [Gemmatimonadaceae bacterium]|nr:hypothetical protein [Gemmatimonadaceae bacterium]